MGSTTIWMVTLAALLAVVTIATVEETLRRRGACLRFQHELRRGAFHPALAPRRARHVRVVGPTERRHAA